MESYAISFIVGIICVMLGISNMRGNIFSLHSYHRHRVSEADKLAFGKKVGFGTVLCGISVMAFGALGALALYTKNQTFYYAGMAVLIAGLAIGLGVSFLAMIKYNKGFF